MAARKTVKTSGRHSSEESASFDNSSSEDSDYVEEDVGDSASFDSSSSEDSGYSKEHVGEVKKNDRVYHVGPRGGKYYINATGKKVYAKAA
ncbi:unnamed protein product [Peronospora belbahrii]|nr:unnamed protein product [Peronospora belbahrii]